MRDASSRPALSQISAGPYGEQRRPAHRAGMSIPRPFRGLLAGLLSLIVFASTAVAMTAGVGPTPLPATAPPATAAAARDVGVTVDRHFDDRDGDGRGFVARDGGGGRGR